MIKIDKNNIRFLCYFIISVITIPLVSSVCCVLYWVAPVELNTNGEIINGFMITLFYIAPIYYFYYVEVYAVRDDPYFSWRAIKSNFWRAIASLLAAIGVGSYFSNALLSDIIYFLPGDQNQISAILDYKKIYGYHEDSMSSRLYLLKNNDGKIIHQFGYRNKYGLTEDILNSISLQPVTVRTKETWLGTLFEHISSDDFEITFMPPASLYKGSNMLLTLRIHGKMVKIPYGFIPPSTTDFLPTKK